MAYSSYGILAFVLHLIINHNVIRKGKLHNPQEPAYRYRQFLNSILVFYTADLTWGFLVESGIRSLAYADTFLFFAAMALSVLLWTRYVVAFLNKKGMRAASFMAAGWGIFAFVALALLVNFFIPVIFLFTSDTEYVPCFGRYILLVLQFLLFIMISLYSFFVSRKAEGREKIHYVAVGASGGVMAVLIVLQTMAPFVPFYTIGCLIANCLIHVFVEEDARMEWEREHLRALNEEKEHLRALNEEKELARRDELTGIRNKTAFTELERSIQDNMEKGVEDMAFAIAVCDLNDLKKINDTMGHKAGDEYLVSSAKILCDIFDHSPVFRIGGDEFAVFLSGDDFALRKQLIERLQKIAQENLSRHEGPVIAVGMAEYDPSGDHNVDEIFERADHDMYEDKRSLKMSLKMT